MRINVEKSYHCEFSTKLSAVRFFCVMDLLLLAAAPAVASSVKLPAGIDFMPTVTADFLYDDNVTNASGDQVESWIVIGASEFLFEAKDKVDTYTFKYGIEKGVYLNSNEDNYVDHDISLGGDWELNSRQRISLDGSYHHGHEERGSGFSRGFGERLLEPDKFSESDVATTFAYGSEETRISMDALLGINYLDYSGIVKSDRNRSSKYGIVTMFASVSGKTDLVAEIGHWRIAYDERRLPDETLDSNETDYLVGVDWKGAKSEASLRMGSRTKRFDSPGRENYTGARWSVTLRWKPLSYSTLELQSERKTEEVQRAGDFVDVTNNAVSWGHQWSGRLSSDLAYGLEKSDYRGADINRDQESQRVVDLTIRYQLRRWLVMRGGHTRKINGASDELFSYQRNISYLGLSVSI